MRYNCVLCNYETDDKSAWYIHKKGQKHIRRENIEKPIIVKSDDDKYKIIIESKDAILSEKEKQLLDKNKQIDQLKKSYEQQIAILKNLLQNQSNQINKYADIVNNSNENIANIANKTLSVAQYLAQKYPDAPPFEEPNYQFIKEAFQNYAVSKQIEFPGSQIIYNYKKHKLAHYIADVITYTYRKIDEPEKQSFWSTDVARKSFKVKQIVDKNIFDKNVREIAEEIDDIVEIDFTQTTNWITDKNGKVIGNKLTNKCIDYIRRAATAYIKKIADRAQINFLEVPESDLDCMYEGKKLLNDLRQKTFISELETNIIKQIAPNFYLDRE